MSTNHDLQAILALVEQINSPEDSHFINLALNKRHRALGHKVAAAVISDKALRVGDPVSFMHNDMKLTGKIKTINAKTCTIETSPFQPPWRVSPQLLTKEALPWAPTP